MEENENHLLLCKSLKSKVGNIFVTFDFVYQDLDKQIIAFIEFKERINLKEWSLYDGPETPEVL